MGTDDETVPSVRLRGNVWNTYMRSRGGGLLGGGVGTSFVSVSGSKLGVIKGYVGGTMVGIEGGNNYFSVLRQEDVM